MLLFAIIFFIKYKIYKDYLFVCILQYSEFSNGCLLHLLPVLVRPQQIYLNVPLPIDFLLTSYRGLLSYLV
jgi:hypothetical protein